MNTLKKAWCQIPEYTGNYRKIARDVFCEVFGERSWEEALEKRRYDAEQSVESIVKKQEEPSKPEVNLDDIRRKLDDLKVSNGVDEDDWETAYAD